jgi:VWFA-related protein
VAAATEDAAANPRTSSPQSAPRTAGGPGTASYNPQMPFVIRRARRFAARPALVSLTLVLTVVGLAAQTPPPASQAPASQAPASQAPAPQQPGAPPAAPGQERPPDFVARVDLVTTDVIARDNQGLFVADLKKDEFEVLEDGVPQSLVSFTLVHGGRVFNVAAPPPPAPQEGIILPPSRPAADAAGRILLFVVDDLHLDFRNTGRLRELFKKIRTTLLHDGDMWGMVSTGPSSIAIDVNYDMKRFDEAMKKITGSALKPNEIIEAPQSSQGPSEVRYRAHVAFSTAYDLVSKMEKINNRRKAVIYVSNGYDFNPFPDARAGGGIMGSNQFNNSSYQEGDMFNMDRSSQQFADADLARELSDLTRAANRANTSFYTIDPRGLIGGPDLDEKVDPVEWGNYVRKSQDSLRVIAVETGGYAVVNQNDFDKALKRIDAETSDYYVIGYYSSNPDPTKKNRKVEVKAKRSNINVWARNSYSLKPPPRVKNKK